jgi:hypothetical protein
MQNGQQSAQEHEQDARWRGEEGRWGGAGGRGRVIEEGEGDAGGGIGGG